MEQLKKLTGLCRQHYEKLILIGALLLLAATVWYLLDASQQEKTKIEGVPRDFANKKGRALKPAALAAFDGTVQQATNPPALNYSGKHNLFNPVKWQQPRPGATIIKVETGKEIGVESLQIKSITPLYLTIAFEGVATSGMAPDLTVVGYRTVLTNELALPPRPRRLSQFIPPKSTNTQVFQITEVVGPAEAPTSLEALLKDFDNEKISFGPGKPYTRTVGYEAELKYPTQGRTFPRLRKESAVDIDGEPYKVVDITPTRVVLSDDSNGKRYAIAQVAGP